jgi:hypothetical protein
LVICAKDAIAVVHIGVQLNGISLKQKRERVTCVLCRILIEPMHRPAFQVFVITGTDVSELNVIRRITWGRITTPHKIE